MSDSLTPAYHGGANLKLVADWLSELDSHSVYDAQMVVTEAPKLGLSARIEAPFVIVTEPKTNREGRIAFSTREQTRRQIEARGLGGWLNPEGPDMLVTGFALAEFMAEFLTGDSGRLLQLQGRGSRHREAIRILRAHRGFHERVTEDQPVSS